MNRKRRNSLMVSLLWMATAVVAQNPIVPAGMYCADPSAHQWQAGGPLYVYGSRDEATDHYCSHHYDVWSTTDMTTWTLHPDVFSSVGANDEVPYNDDLLYAPDCLLRDGTYYLYYSMGGWRDVEGVAVASLPTGPFRQGQPIAHATQIDPAAFVDDDGQPYLFWGQFAAKMARLKPNMREIDPQTLRDSIITEEGHHFHEGIQVLKRGDFYYLVFADISRRGMPTCLGYAMSRRLEGPYEYKGVIIDNFGCDPYVWNNHGSLASFNGQWYVFYHRATNGSVQMRKACVEPIHFNDDGTISEVEMTTQGAAPPLDPFRRTEAARACYLTGSVRVSEVGKGAEQLTHIADRNTAAYKYFDFKRRPRHITFQVTPLAGGTIDVFANTLSRPRLASIRVPKGDGQTALTLTADIDETVVLQGVHPIFLRFHAARDSNDGAEQLFTLDWFQFGC